MEGIVGVVQSYGSSSFLERSINTVVSEVEISGLFYLRPEVSQVIWGSTLFLSRFLRLKKNSHSLNFDIRSGIVSIIESLK